MHKYGTLPGSANLVEPSGAGTSSIFYFISNGTQTFQCCMGSIFPSNFSADLVFCQQVLS